MKRFLGTVAVAVTAAACTQAEQPEARSISEVSKSQPSQTASPVQPATNELLLSGTVKAKDGLAVPEGATLFVMGRAPDRPGPPVLVKRFRPATLPLEFSLTGQDQMMQGMPVPETLQLSARLDQDGDAISKTPGDLVGVLATVARGSKGVELVLGDVVTEPKPSAPVQ
ncbi:MAG: hypothetical protein AAF654_05455 [Myxococcota bacterium]